MSYDGIVVKSVVLELNSLLLGGRIEKVYQPEADELILNIRNRNINYKLLISASSSNARVYITETTKNNPKSPPMFCMLLRKHIQGGKIVNIYQYSLDRVICLEIQTLDELGNLSVKTLIVEIMGKHSNIILIDKATNTIIDSIKRVPLTLSSVRQILPGLKYKSAPSQNKIMPIGVDKSAFINLIDNSSKALPIYKMLYGNIIGLSPLIAREICFRANLDSELLISQLDLNAIDLLYGTFKNFYEVINMNKFQPTIIKDKDGFEIIAFSAVDIQQFSDVLKIQYDSISKLLENYYLIRDKMDRVKHKTSDLKKSISIKLDRALKKLSKQKEELIEAEKRDIFKIYGDLLTANLYKIENKQREITLENFYSEKLEQIKIKLDPRLSPVQNAQKYYKKYNKLKKAYKLVSEQIVKTKEEIDYLENILLSLDNCTELKEIEEIKEELVNEGYLRKTSIKNKKREKEFTSSPHHFISSDGYDIFIGKNNKQNDYLTLKLANKDDIWLHTKNIPGSHVIIKRKEGEIPQNTMLEAAKLSAYYSKAKLSNNVPVDFTERRNVKKPSGAKPGMVIYDHYNTIYVTPDKELLRKLNKIN